MTYKTIALTLVSAVPPGQLGLGCLGATVEQARSVRTRGGQHGDRLGTRRAGHRFLQLLPISVVSLTGHIVVVFESDQRFNVNCSQVERLYQPKTVLNPGDRTVDDVR